MKTIEKISEIKSGYLFKEGIVPDKGGSVRVIQLKDVNEAGLGDSHFFQRVELPNSESMDFVIPGDVLFKAKTNRPVAAVVGEDLDRTIVTAHFFVLRIQDRQILPAYLAWYLNQRPAQTYFGKYAGGTRVQVINKQVLGGLKIAIPSIEAQKRIERIHALRMKELELAKTIYEKKSRLISSQLVDLISKEA
jgi:restriction endonuclease S subunit